MNLILFLACMPNKILYLRVNQNTSILINFLIGHFICIACFICRHINGGAEIYKVGKRGLAPMQNKNLHNRKSSGTKCYKVMK